MQEIIKAQEGKKPDINSEELSLGSETFDYSAPTEGEISSIDMKYLNMLARTLGAPGDAWAGLFLHKKLGDKVQKWEKLITCYANSVNKLNLTKELFEEKSPYTFS